MTLLERREFVVGLGLSFAMASHSVPAQQAPRIRRIGFLSSGWERLPYLVEGMADLGYVEGKDYLVLLRHKRRLRTVDRGGCDGVRLVAVVLPQHGQRGSLATSARLSRRRSVAIDVGT